MKVVGFDKALKIEWLDEVAFILLDKKKNKNPIEHINSILSEEVLGFHSRKKCVTVLNRIWINVPSENKELQNKAIVLIKQISPEERLALHWGMSLIAYPFFVDIANIIGTLLKRQKKITVNQTKRRIVKSWGERSTVDYATSRALKTLVNFGVIARESLGQYTKTEQVRIDNNDLIIWLLECLFVGKGINFVPFEYLDKNPILFPFSYELHLQDFFVANRFELSKHDLNKDVVKYCDSRC